MSDASSKLGLPKIETIESIDANHMQMARCKDRSDESYRFIVAVVKQFLGKPDVNMDQPVRSVTHTQQDLIPAVIQEVEARQ